MPAPLLNPDNKLLSWSIGDIGLYGAAITPATLAAAQEQKATTEAASEPADRADDSAGTGPASLAMSEDLPSSVAADRSAADPAAIDLGVLSLATALPLATLTAPAVPTPGAPAEMSGGSGSGVFVPAPVPPPTSVTVPTALDSDGGSAHPLMSPVLPTGATAVAPSMTVPAIQAAVESASTSPVGTDDLAATVTDTVDVVADAVVAPVASLATPIVESVAEVATSATGLATGTVAVVGEAVGAVVTEAAAPLASAVTDTVASTVTAATGTVTPQIAAIVDTLAETTSVAAAPVAEVADSVSAAIGDLLSGVGGTDPAGGVQTLVSMVAAADEYDLTQIATAPVAESGSIVDLLAVDIADVPILGDVHHDDASDDGSLGVFGL